MVADKFGGVILPPNKAQNIIVLTPPSLWLVDEHLGVVHIGFNMHFINTVRGAYGGHRPKSGKPSQVYLWLQL